MRLQIPILLFILLSPLSAHAYKAAVVSAHPVATKVGMQVLKEGGSAADAAIATALALTVVEPHNSGLGGGGFLLYFEAKSKQFYFIDYRETAPQRLPVSRFLRDPAVFDTGIASVGVPGTPEGLYVIHQKWRRLSWSRLIEPSIRLAQKGISINGVLKKRLIASKESLEKDPEIKKIFWDQDGNLKGKLVQTDLAKTLEDYRTGGPSVFYRGDLAKKIAETSKKQGGYLDASDLNAYRALERKPHQFRYRDYDVVSAGLPSSGGIGLDLLFKRTIINNVAKVPDRSADAYELILEGLKDYLDYRDRALGDPLGHTTHLSVIDSQGNVASMTNTLNSPFGARVMVPGTGIILNNELSDFNAVASSANAPRGGARPLSSMSPTIVLKKQQPILALGTPGGLTIPQNLYQVLFFHWDGPISLAKAVAQPKIYYVPQNHQVWVEKGLSKSIREALGRENQVIVQPQIGNVQALVINPKTTQTVTDPRGEGKGLVD